MSPKSTIAFGLQPQWLAYCARLKAEVSDVEALAGQGRILEAYRLLQERLAGTDTGATGLLRPAVAPFVLLATPAVIGLAAALQTAASGVAAAGPALLTASAVPTNGFAAFAYAAQQRGLPVFVAVSSQPSLSSKFRAAIVKRRAVSKQVFVWKRPETEASNG